MNFELTPNFLEREPPPRLLHDPDRGDTATQKCAVYKSLFLCFSFRISLFLIWYLSYRLYQIQNLKSQKFFHCFYFMSKHYYSTKLMCNIWNKFLILIAFRPNLNPEAVKLWPFKEEICRQQQQHKQQQGRHLTTGQYRNELHWQKYTTSETRSETIFLILWSTRYWYWHYCQFDRGQNLKPVCCQT